MIKIGRQKTSDIQFDQITVSNHHATAFYINNEIIIEDADSKNGTLINGRRIKRSILLPTDHIQFGDIKLSGSFLIDKVLKVIHTEKVDFTEDYTLLLQTLKRYEESKNNILKKPVLPLIIKIVTSFILIVVLLFFQDKLPPNSIYPLIILIGVFTGIIGYFDGSAQKRKKRYDLLKLEYEEYLRCPKCRVALINYSFLYLNTRNKCVNTKCSAIYNAK